MSDELPLLIESREWDNIKGIRGAEGISMGMQLQEGKYNYDMQARLVMVGQSVSDELN